MHEMGWGPIAEKDSHISDLSKKINGNVILYERETQVEELS